MTNETITNQQTRTKGVDALNSNIEAAKTVSEIVKTTLGPMGMDKMLIDELGNTVITNDGVKILREMTIEHPGAKMLVEVAKTQEQIVGDGTTTAVIYAGELLNKAQELISKKIHPTNIIRGFKQASEKAKEILEKNSIKVDTKSEKLLREIVEVAMTGKVADTNKEFLSKLLFEVIKLTSENDKIDKNNIKIIKIVGSEIEDSQIIKGIILEKEIANNNMPKNIENAKVLLLDFPLEVRELDNSANLQINTPEDYQNFLNSETEYLKSLAYKIKNIGANVVICQKGIDDNVAYYLAKQGILAVRRCRKSDLSRLSKALNINILNNSEDIQTENLAIAGRVKQEEINGFNYIFVEKIENPKSISLILKSSTNHLLDEIERAVDDAIGDLNSILESKRIVAGGGAIEIELYRELLEYSKTLIGKNQIIVQKFAEMFLEIPKTLCNNSGFDEIDTMSELILNHEKGLSKSGINGFIGIVDSTIDEKIIEPINIKSQAIKTATETASMILRIDDIIAAKKLNQMHLNEIKNVF